MEFAYIEKTSLIDYPQRISSVLFTIGCNFRCPFCHNRTLVIPGEYPVLTLTESTAFAILSNRKRYIDSVVITGGEPTIHPELPSFIQKLKDDGMHVKLDTNGTNPEMLKGLLAVGALDYVAMDAKAPKDRYSITTGIEVSDEMLRNIESSIRTVVNSKVPYEIRTTIVPGIHTVDDIERMCEWLAELGVAKFVIQTFRPVKGALIDASLETVSEFRESEVAMFVDAAKKKIENVELRDYKR